MVINSGFAQLSVQAENSNMKKQQSFEDVDVLMHLTWKQDLYDFISAPGMFVYSRFMETKMC